MIRLANTHCFGPAIVVCVLVVFWTGATAAKQPPSFCSPFTRERPSWSCGAAIATLPSKLGHSLTATMDLSPVLPWLEAYQLRDLIPTIRNYVIPPSPPPPPECWYFAHMSRETTCASCSWSVETPSMTTLSYFMGRGVCYDCFLRRCSECQTTQKPVFPVEVFTLSGRWGVHHSKVELWCLKCRETSEWPHRTL
jgi:hypothetical protein